MEKTSRIKGQKFNKKEVKASEELTYLDNMLNKINSEIKNAHIFISNLNKQKKLIQNIMERVE